MLDTTIEQLLASEVVSSGLPDVQKQSEQKASMPAPTQQLKITVAWGDLPSVTADIHVAGHYRGVMPTAAERRLDEAISPPGPCGIICEHTRRRWLVGALGEVTYFPGRVDALEAGNQVQRAAVVGMGRVGTFTEDNATRLYQSLLREIMSLRHIRTVATVLIGSGAGNLLFHQVARAVVTGFGNALRSLASESNPIVPDVVVVELDRLRAELCHRALRDAAESEPLITVEPVLASHPGGRLNTNAAAVYGIRGLLERLANAPDPLPPDDPTYAILAAVPADLRGQVHGRLAEIATRSADVANVHIDSHRSGNGGDQAPPTRVTVLRVPTGVVWSALTARATVPERVVPVNDSLMDQLVQRLTPPSDEDVTELPAFLTRFMVPLDLQHYLDGQAPLIIEVDLRTARVPWELLVCTQQSSGQGTADEPEPLAIQQCLSRQMRTTYARTDLEESPVEEMRALVIGDPGDPGSGMSLPEAREEAADVADLLRDHKIDVDLFIGAPGSQLTPSARFATRLDVLAKMHNRNYHIIHYAGHGVFAPNNPELSGWLFADGLLAARELTQFSQAPRLVMADACWSAAHPDTPANEAPQRGDPSRLAPVLADEFFRVGTGHVIGTSWALPDKEARTFATSFYNALLGGDGKPPMSVGQAVRQSRQHLWKETRKAQAASPEQRCAWAAYQHYGDPADHLVPEVAPSRTQ